MAVPLTDFASGIVFMVEWIKIGKMGENEPVNIFSYIFLHGYEIRNM